MPSFGRTGLCRIWEFRVWRNILAYSINSSDQIAIGYGNGVSVEYALIWQNGVHRTWEVWVVPN